MQRTIKFRGKRVDGKGWFRGLLALNRSDENSYYIQSPLYDSDGYRGYQQYEVTPETVGQFTGLTDRNGKEIYEGDIVRYHPEMNAGIGRVVYLGSGFYVTDEFNGLLDDFAVMGIEVIGNIHDNPELLGERK